MPSQPWAKHNLPRPRSGEQNSAWKGGKWDYFRARVLERDDFTCVDCGVRDTEPGFMEADHIIERAIAPHLANDITNGATRCPNCHKRKTLKFLREHSKRRRAGHAGALTVDPPAKDK